MIATISNIGCIAFAALSIGVAGAADEPPAATKTSLEPRFPVEDALRTIRSQWVHRKSIDWPAVEKDVREKSNSAKSEGEKIKEFVRLFARKGDVHSSITFNGRNSAHYEGVEEPLRQRLMPMMERQRKQTNAPIVKLLDGRIGYVFVPAFQAANADEVQRMADAFGRQMREAVKNSPKAWIVDLRLNGGGNLYPMLAGLHPLIGDGVVGGTKNANGETVQEWVLKPDGLYWRDRSGDRSFVEIKPPSTPSAAMAPTAVLVGPLTMSSGQALALAFKGRANCTSIGEPTAKGYTTVMNPTRIDDATSLNLAVGFMTDRNGTACKEVVLPEAAETGEDSFDELTKDAKIGAARRWFDQMEKEKPPSP